MLYLFQHYNNLKYISMNVNPAKKIVSDSRLTTYQKKVINDALDSVGTQVPTLPTANGKYALRITNGVATWEVTT